MVGRIPLKDTAGVRSSLGLLEYGELVVHARLIRGRSEFDSLYSYALVIYWYYPCLPNRRTEFDSPLGLALDATF